MLISIYIRTAVCAASFDVATSTLVHEFISTLVLQLTCLTALHLTHAQQAHQYVGFHNALTDV